MFKSFQGKLVIWFALIFVAIQAAVMLLVYQATKSYMVSAAKTELHQAGEVFSLQLARRFEWLKDEATLLSLSSMLTSALQQRQIGQARDVLDDIHESMGYDVISVVDDQGQVVVSANKRTKQNNYNALLSSTVTSLASPNRQAESMQFYVEDGSIFMVAEVPLLDRPQSRQSNYRLHLGIRLDAQFLARLKKHYTLDIDTVVGIFETQQQGHPVVVGTQNQDKGPGELSPLLEQYFKNEELTARNQVQLLSLEGGEYLVLPLRLAGQSQQHTLRALVMVKVATIMQGPQTLMLWLGLIFLFGLLLIVLFALFLGRSMARPLRELLEVVNAARQGRYLNKVVSSGHDEFATLGRAFADMVEAVDERENTIRYQLMHDMNTGLPNRLHFTRILADHLREIQPGRKAPASALLFVKIERVEEINNILGHDAGDRVAFQIAERLHNHLTVTALAYFSVNQFAMLVNGYTRKQLEDMGSRLCERLEKPLQVGDSVVDVNPVIGICMIDNPDIAVATWMRHADQAVEMALSEGIAVSFYDADKDKHSAAQLSMMGELIHGIANQELEMRYQMKAALTKAESSYHCEALVRWNHPRKGLMQPNEFIPLAEKTGQIRKLTEWAVDQVASQIKEWEKQGWAVKVSVNISVKNLLDKTFPAFLAQVLENHEVCAGRLILEITENELMRNIQQSITALTSIRRMGIKVAIDDFGTGQASFEYLKRLPVDELKIDRLFVLQMAENPNDALIIRALIGLSHSLGLLVTAEGVETVQAHHLLKEYECDYGQGYFYSVPLSGQALTQRLAENNPL